MFGARESRYVVGMKTPRGWRAITVDGVGYLWCGKIGTDTIHDPLRIFVRRAVTVDGRARARGSTLVVDTGFGGPHRCTGPQCSHLPPPHPIGPAAIAAFVQQALGLGWADTGVALRVVLDTAAFVRGELRVFRSSPSRASTR